MDNELMVKSIRTICKKNNISVSQLENELNFGAGLVSRWVKSSPSLDKIVDIADYFNVSVDEIIGRNVNIKSKSTENFIDRLYNMTSEGSIIWVNESNNVFKMIESEDCSIEDDGYNFFELYSAKYGEGFIYLYAQYDKEKGVISDIDIQLYIKPNKNASLVLQECDETKSYDLWYYVQAKFNGELDEIQAEEFKNDFINNQSRSPIDSYSDEQLKQITKNMIEMEPQLPKVFEAINDPEFLKLLDILKSPKLQQGLELAQKLSPHYLAIMAHELGHISKNKKTP